MQSWRPENAESKGLVFGMLGCGIWAALFMFFSGWGSSAIYWKLKTWLIPVPLPDTLVIVAGAALAFWAGLSFVRIAGDYLPSSVRPAGEPNTAALKTAEQIKTEEEEYRRSPEYRRLQERGWHYFNTGQLLGVFGEEWRAEEESCIEEERLDDLERRAEDVREALEQWDEWEERQADEEWRVENERRERLLERIAEAREARTLQRAPDETRSGES